MSAPVKLPAIFSGIRSRKDRSYSLTFETRELGGSYAAELLKLQQTECWLLVAPDDSLDAVDVPQAKPDSGTNQRTASQRLRAILFVYWQQLGKPDGDFENFYRVKVERIIDQYKALLDSGEVSV
jgi:hypothetical protein